MIQRIQFYFTYALRNIRRGGRWTTLAILCITAGVATVVALRTLGLAIGDTLIQNVRIETKGDMLVYNDSLFSGFGGRNLDTIPSDRLGGLLTWANEHNATTSAFMSGNNVQITRLDENSFGRPSFVGSYFINPQTYPPTHTIKAIDPAGVPLADLFTGDNELVISDNLAKQNSISVGDEVRVSGTDQIFIVKGIVSAAEETTIFNFLNGFFGYAYFDLENSKAVINAEYAPNRVGILLPNQVTEPEMESLIGEIERIVPSANVLNTFALLERYEIIAQYLGDFIVVMGLGALLIGGVGIMNTMLVLVRRRTNEIAAIKTFGVKGRQVATLFLAEALILGLLGSILGIIVGIGLSLLVNQYGSVALSQPLVWRIYPEALVFGFVLGVVVTAIFGVAPILTAVKVRPGIILRPNESHLPALGVIQSLLMLVFVTISLGLIVGQIVRPSFELTQERLEASRPIEQDIAQNNQNGTAPQGTRSNLRNFRDNFEVPSPYLIGIAGVAGTFLFLGILIGILWVIVWLVGKFPTFGNVTLRLALRNLSTHRLRTATTLLALSAGMFALSSITFVGEGTRELLNIQLSRSFGGNVLVFPFPGIPDSLIQLGLNNALKDVQIDYRTAIRNYSAELVQADDQVISNDSTFAFNSWDSNNPKVYDAFPDPVEGRQLIPTDRGQAVLVMPSDIANRYGIQAGSIVTLSIEGNRKAYEVIGITPNMDGDFSNPLGASVNIAPDSIPEGLGARFTFYTYQVSDEHLNQALAQLSSVPLVLSLDVSFIDGLISRLIKQFTAIPTIVGILSLFAAAVIMANTVALSTLERRRQIGVLKAIGLKSRKVLTIMLIESTIIGALSALLGIGMSGLGMALMLSSGGVAVPLPADARLTVIGLIIASVVISWIATFLSARVAVNERVMNVLRYE